ncbi:J domain-containing protein [Aurantiacibacter hainanensis]|uniref:J domain-containing protein n=1 Tax=Aurantiacibacter hainanensis TaxID=3076114 RepID=UPI0030C6FB79
MGKFIVIVGVVILLYYWIFKRWPWQPKVSAREQAVTRARETLGVSRFATRNDIIAAHKRLVALVHPDRGGSSEQVHEANAARDLLLDGLPDDTK